MVFKGLSFILPKRWLLTDVAWRTDWPSPKQKKNKTFPENRGALARASASDLGRGSEAGLLIAPNGPGAELEGFTSSLNSVPQSVVFTDVALRSQGLGSNPGSFVHLLGGFGKVI